MVDKNILRSLLKNSTPEELCDILNEVVKEEARNKDKVAAQKQLDALFNEKDKPQETWCSVIYPLYSWICNTYSLDENATHNLQKILSVNSFEKICDSLAKVANKIGPTAENVVISFDARTDDDLFHYLFSF